MKRLEGKSALITGSARGIGKTFARAYLAEGASVAIADINLQAARATAQELGDGAYPVDMDVTRTRTSIERGDGRGRPPGPASWTS